MMPLMGSHPDKERQTLERQHGGRMTMDAGPTVLICWATFSEEFVIQAVFDSSPKFRAFFEAERSKLDGPIH